MCLFAGTIGIDPKNLFMKIPISMVHCVLIRLKYWIVIEGVDKGLT